MEKNKTIPSVKRTAFHCPHCNTKAPQRWLHCYGDNAPEETNLPAIYTKEFIDNHIKAVKEHNKESITEEYINYLNESVKEAESGGFLLKELTNYTSCAYSFKNIFFSVCQERSCKKAALWIGDRLINPATQIAVPPNDDMPENIKAIFNEARAIHGESPRASAALLRLCCEMLCDHLDAKGANLGVKIGNLVAKGMDEGIQKALDIVRFIGNESVHPGQIDLKDNQDISTTLFMLVNEIVQEMISKEKRLNSLYTEQLPSKVREKINLRDNKGTE